ncbi:hypothetical protein ACFSCZ_00615 [Siminovitchia sediminis]|uniref:Uncharacterized protein n=1 Tax=Siminovitchia sediminis TaxID=1274353 RepID=A0ABW4KER8_9BACI
MDLSVISYGENLNVTLGVIKAFREESVVFSLNGEEVVIPTSTNTLNRLKEIVEENEFALIPIHMETKTVILDFKIPEQGLAELVEGIDEPHLL